jgi:hypothetical protein
MPGGLTGNNGVSGAWRRPCTRSTPTPLPGTGRPQREGNFLECIAHTLFPLPHRAEESLGHSKSRDSVMRVGMCLGERRTCVHAVCVCYVCVQKGAIHLWDDPERVDVEGLTLSSTPVPGPSGMLGPAATSPVWTCLGSLGHRQRGQENPSQPMPCWTLWTTLVAESSALPT